MCGFAFNYGGFVGVSQIQESLSLLKHRGPDAQLLKDLGSVKMAHARLSIMDLSDAAHQPFSSSCGNYHIVFNGEIYNFQELKQQLKFKDWKTSGDTEVLLQWCIEKGSKALNELNGFFAFVFYDQLENKIWGARDRMGIKPFYYEKADAHFSAASSLKAMLPILNALNLKEDIDQRALSHYLDLSYYPGDSTALKQVKTLLPGHFFELNPADDSFRIHRFSEEKKEDFKGGFEDAKKELKDVLYQAVERRLIADVSLGTFLSGGIDSSIVSAIAKDLKNDVQSYSISFSEQPYLDETVFAKAVADKIGTKHHVFDVTKAMIQADKDAFFEVMDEPFADSSALAVFQLTKLVRNDMAVALSGDGADELFGGYRKHQAFLLSEQKSIKNLGLKILSPLFQYLPQSRELKWGDLFRKLDKYGELLSQDTSNKYKYLAHQVQKSDVLKRKSNEGWMQDEVSDLNTFLKADQKYVLPNDMLRKVDLMSMGNSLEVRVPFLDVNVVELANSFPPDFKIQGEQQKRVLLEAFKDHLPEMLWSRPKKGFEVPLKSYIASIFSDELQENILNLSYIEEQNLFNFAKITETYNRFKSENPGDSPTLLWELICFQNWYNFAKRYETKIKSTAHHQ